MFWTFQKYGGPRGYNNAAATIGTNIFMFGGRRNESNDYTSGLINVHVLDTVKLKWLKPELLKDQDTDCVPFERYGHTVVAIGSNIYLFGGRSEIEVCNTLYCFDTNTLKWSKPDVKGNIPIARDGHSACVIKNCMYIFGGIQKPFTPDLYKFDFESMMWSFVVTTGPNPSGRHFHTATAIDDKMYIYGGHSHYFTPYPTASDNYRSLFFYLDTSTLTWKASQNSGYFPIPRRCHSAFVYNGFIYIFGGNNRIKGLHFNDLNRFDPVGCTWTKLYPKGMPPCTMRRLICQVLDNKIFMCGGTSPCVSNNYAICGFKEYDLHVLDMNPSLKDLCLVDVADRFKEMNVDDLCIPVSLKCELGTVNPKESIQNCSGLFVKKIFNIGNTMSCSN